MTVFGIGDLSADLHNLHSILLPRILGFVAPVESVVNTMTTKTKFEEGTFASKSLHHEREWIDRRSGNM